jgi:hypothetical protein
MQTKTINGNEPADGHTGDTSHGPSGTAGDTRRETALGPLFAGAAVGIAGVGAVLALAGLSSALRAPFTVFFLISAPAAAIAAALRRLDPLSRTVVAVAGALAVNLLVAQAMLSLHLWSARGGVAAVAALSGALFLLAGARSRRASRAPTPGSVAD